jgi:hypothetical protein
MRHRHPHKIKIKHTVCRSFTESRSPIIPILLANRILSLYWTIKRGIGALVGHDLSIRVLGQPRPTKRLSTLLASVSRRSVILEGAMSVWLGPYPGQTTMIDA